MSQSSKTTTTIRMKRSSAPSSGNGQISAKSYNAAVESLELKKAILIDARHHIDPRYFAIRNNEDQWNEASHSYEHCIREVSFSEDSKCVVAVIEWTASVSYNDDEIYSASAAFFVIHHYKSEVGVDIDDDKKRHGVITVQKLIPYITYPYFRSFVSQLNWMGELDLPVMPILKEEK